MRRLAPLVLLLALAGCRRGPQPPAPDATLSFVRAGTRVTLSARELCAAIPLERVDAWDPYYRRDKHWLALPLRAILERGFPRVTIESESFLLRAKDGYAVPVAGALLVEPGGFVALADLDAPAWEPIGPQRADPSPFYLGWSGAQQRELENHPRPWALATIEIARVEEVFPHVLPAGEPPGSPAMRGFSLFRDQCLRCHAINREGGRVGPDLNVPRSIVEYRPTAQIREYIRDPLAFRYGTMPAHPQLSDGDLDALIAYFQAMQTRKHDPEGRPGK